MTVNEPVKIETKVTLPRPTHAMQVRCPHCYSGPGRSCYAPAGRDRELYEAREHALNAIQWYLDELGKKVRKRDLEYRRFGVSESIK